MGWRGGAVLTVRKTICNNCRKMVDEYRELAITTYSGQDHITHQDPHYTIHICRECEDDTYIGPVIAEEFKRIMAMEGKDD